MNISKKVFICLVLVLFLASCRMNEVQDVTSSASTDSRETEGSMPQSADTSAASQQTTNIQSEPTAEQSESEPLEDLPLELPDDFYESISLPKIEDFSGTEYEDYEYTFGPVESAVLKHNETEIEISPDDPRLIRLINFLMYSNHASYSTWLHGYEEDQAIREEYLSTDEPMLVVNLNSAEIDDKLTFGNIYQLVISSNSYLLMIDYDPDNYSWANGGLLAYQITPYTQLLLDNADQSMLEKISLYPSWDDHEYCWLKLLEYAGLVVE